MSPQWPHQMMRQSLFDEETTSVSEDISKWDIYGWTLSEKCMAQLITPYNRNRFGQLIGPRESQTDLCELEQFAFYDSKSGGLRAYDFSRQIAFFLLTPSHSFAEWEIFNPFKEFWHYWALFHDALLVHSGVVCQNNQALVILGPGGAGKSTTTLSCLEFGMKTTGDDFNMLCIDEEKILVYPVFTSLKTKKGNALVMPFKCLESWAQYAYANGQKTIYFPKRSDPIWQSGPAQVAAFIEPYWQSQHDQVSDAKQPCLKGAVGAVLQHPYLAKRYLSTTKRMMKILSCYPLALSNQPQKNVARIKALFASVSH